MYLYFLSPVPCALKVNGNFSGIVTENYSILPFTEGFYEMLPLSARRFPLRFELTKDMKTPDNIRIIDLYGGFLVIPDFPSYTGGKFCLFGKQKIFLSRGEVLVTCYRGDGIRLIAESDNGLAIENLPFLPDAVKFEKIATGKKEYLFCAIEAEKTLLVAFDPSEGLKVVFRMLCADYKLHGNRLETTEVFKDIVGHKRITVWEFGDRPVSVSVSVTGARPVYALTEKLFPYAFFEEFPIGGDVSDYLTLRLRPRADELADFLGEFTSVLPPPHFAPQDSVLLLRENGIDYAKAEMSGGAIDNVTLIDKQDHTW